MRTSKKVALLFSGQVREISPKIFNDSLVNFTEFFDEVDIYLSYWSEPGISLGHNFDNLNNPDALRNFDVESYLEKAFVGFNIKSTYCESYNSWKRNYDATRSDSLKESRFDPVTVHAAPQFYQLYQSFNLVADRMDEYDIVFRCRYDTIYLMPFNEFEILPNMVYNINFGGAYYKNRIYDIFFYGSSSSMKPILNSWLNFEFLVEHSFENGLDRRDPCRMLFITAIENHISVKSCNVRYCDIMRATISIYVYFCNLVHYGLIKEGIIFSFKLRIKFFAYKFITKTLNIPGACLFFIFHPLLRASKEFYSSREIKIGKKFHFF